MRFSRDTPSVSLPRGKDKGTFEPRNSKQLPQTKSLSSRRTAAWFGKGANISGLFFFFKLHFDFVIKLSSCISAAVGAIILFLFSSVEDGI